eukprot:4123239-Prymnesium_polylepis.1
MVHGSRGAHVLRNVFLDIRARARLTRRSGDLPSARHHALIRHHRVAISPPSRAHQSSSGCHQPAITRSSVIIGLPSAPGSIVAGVTATSCARSRRAYDLYDHELHECLYDCDVIATPWVRLRRPLRRDTPTRVPALQTGGRTARHRSGCPRCSRGRWSYRRSNQVVICCGESVLRVPYLPSGRVAHGVHGAHVAHGVHGAH